MKIDRYRIGVFVALALLLAAAGAGIWLRLDGSAAEASEAGLEGLGDAAPVSATDAFATDMPIPVEGAPAVRDTLVVSVKASGQAAAVRSAVLRAQVGGQLVRVPVREGQAVAGGALLALVDTAEYRLAVRQAEAELERARAAYREQTLFDDRIEDASVRAERERVARAKSGLDAALVGLEKARLELARSRVVAPFPGRVATVRVVPGEWVQPGDELATIVDLDPVEVEVQVLETDVGHLAAGGLASVTFSAFPDQPFAGRIATINPVVSEDTRTAKVTLLVPNPGGRILPGMYARVSLAARRYADRVLVPREALLERDRRSMLFVYEGDASGGLAKWRYVTTGLQNDAFIELVPTEDTEMVEPGEVVLTGGHYTLIHDARVRLVEDAGGAGGRPN